MTLEENFCFNFKQKAECNYKIHLALKMIKISFSWDANSLSLAGNKENFIYSRAIDQIKSQKPSFWYISNKIKTPASLILNNARNKKYL